MIPTSSKPLTICYFGIYPPTSPRDKMYLQGVREEGINVIEVYDNAPGIKKYFNLIKKHKEVSGTYDILYVGYLSTIVMPLAWLITSKKIVFNALASLYETLVLDRQTYRPISMKALLTWILDFISFQVATKVLVESEAQKKFIVKAFHVKQAKFTTLWTGADEKVFYPLRQGENIQKHTTFTVVFRGLFLPATGVEYVIEAAKILRNEDINFVVIGRGQIEEKIKKQIKDNNLNKVTLIDHYLEPEELRKKMLEGHVILGQFSSHERMNRTIQHKTFEALALGMPYITRDSESNRELLVDNNTCLFVRPADSEDLAQKILELKSNNLLRMKLGHNARELFEKKITYKILGKQLAQVLRMLQ